MKKLSEFNAKISFAIKSRLKVIEIEKTLLAQKIPDQYFVKICEQPVKVPLCYLMPVLMDLELHQEIFEICTFKFRYF